MKRILIAGIGNVLLQDDGFGPCVVSMLEARYRFESNIEVIDLGTPGLDLAEYLSGKDCVILIDSMKSDRRPGTILLYRMPEILHGQVAPGMGPHAPALMETLLSMEILGSAPADILLVGVAGESYEPGCYLSEPVRMSVNSAIDIIVCELARLGAHSALKRSCTEPDIWWMRPLPVQRSQGAGAAPNTEMSTKIVLTGA
jgi:hydrogenase maturation protease